MLKICAEKWAKNKEALKAELWRMDLDNIEYKDLVRVTFQEIFNDDSEDIRFDVNNITEIDNGSYQGTLLYLIPFDTFQPDESEYVMTYVNYGSCSGCDSLEAIKSEIPHDDYYEPHPNEQNIKDTLTLCLNLIQNAIRPYNSRWSHDERFDHMQYEDVL